MSRDPGTSEGEQQAGRDLWPASARNVPRLRGQVIGGGRDSAVVRTGGAAISVSPLADVDDPRDDGEEVVVFIKGTRVAIRLDGDHGVAPAPPRNGHRALQPGRGGHLGTGDPPSVEVVHRDSVERDADDGFIRRTTLSVPWQETPIEVWTSPADDADRRDDAHIDATLTRSEPADPAGDDTRSGRHAAEDPHGWEWPVGDDDPRGDARFRSVWESQILHPGAEAADERKPHVGGTDPGSREETLEEPMTSDEAISRLRPRRKRGILRRVAMLVVVVGLIAGALYGGSIVGARLIGDGSPAESPAPPATPDVVIRNVADTGDATLSRFNVERPWAVNWTSEGTGPFLILAVASDGQRTTLVDVTAPDDGTAEIDDTGVFSLEVVAEGKWRLTVVERSASDS